MCTAGDRSRKIKDARDLVFSDDFMFGAVMQDKDICKEVLECILDIKIERIEFPERQKAIEQFYSTHGVRFDIYVEGGSKIYEIEMQNGSEPDLDERTRFYQSMIDMDFMEKGHPYSEVRDCYIIFLCRYDPYKLGNPCYTFSMRCEENPHAKSNYRVTQKIFNCTAYDKAKRPELRAFLQYVQKNEASSAFTRRISDMVEVKKEQQGFLTAYYVYKMHEDTIKNAGKREGFSEGRLEGLSEGLEKGRTEGLEKGAEKARLENAKNLLKMNVCTHEQIAQAVGLPLETIEELAEQVPF